MKSGGLQNLYLGETRGDVAWPELTIGPFTVALCDDYDRLVSGIPKRPASKEDWERALAESQAGQAGGKSQPSPNGNPLAQPACC